MVPQLIMVPHQHLSRQVMVISWFHPCYRDEFQCYVSTYLNKPWQARDFTPWCPRHILVPLSMHLIVKSQISIHRNTSQKSRGFNLRYDIMEISRFHPLLPRQFLVPCQHVQRHVMPISRFRPLRPATTFCLSCANSFISLRGDIQTTKTCLDRLKAIGQGLRPRTVGTN